MELSQKMTRYLLEGIDSDGYSEKPVETDKQKIDFIGETFFAEYGWAVPRMGLQKAVTEWLQGLPSTVNIVFYNHDIISLYKKWGALPQDATNKQEDAILEMYWPLAGLRLSLLIAKSEAFTKQPK